MNTLRGSCVVSITGPAINLIRIRLNQYRKVSIFDYMTKWEYHIFQVLGAVSTQKLNEFGNNGWELVSIIVKNLYRVYTFKRPIESKKC